MKIDTTTEGKHSPLPWRFSTKPQPNGCPIIGIEKGLMVAMLAHSVNEPKQKEEALANAEYIIDCCNSHPSLLALVEELGEALSCAVRSSEWDYNQKLTTRLDWTGWKELLARLPKKGKSKP